MFKKIKIEEVEVSEDVVLAKQPSISLFRKPVVDPTAGQPLVGQLKKNNVSSFIKKKPIDVKTETSEKDKTASGSDAKPATSSLLNMMSSYAGSSDESSD